MMHEIIREDLETIRTRTREAIDLGLPVMAVVMCCQVEVDRVATNADRTTRTLFGGGMP